MLVLSRKEGQILIIDHRIEIVILEIRGKQVKIGIKAPESVQVLRGELYERIRKENLRAIEAPQKLPEIKDLKLTIKEGTRCLSRLPVSEE